ncbi:Uma2 family endonuclease [Emticicia agri]|uniref:Uma2 family endonuclease n=2 Tax=Emticicia agri TaxID=2492393 RepID=A0A4Q5M2L8_9BACT|nr:Uma2 family endonuclease [Emticicia agri]
MVMTTEKWTYSDMLAKLPAESRYEIRNYNLIDMPSPTEKHQELQFKLTLLLGNHIVANKLGKFYQAPFDVILDEGNTVQPDLLFVSNENKEIIKERGVFGAPDLMIEIVSKGSIIRDYVEKKEDYEKFGIKEYWIIDPQNKFIQIFSLESNKYKPYSSADGEESLSVKSIVLTGFELQWSDLFE